VQQFFKNAAEVKGEEPLSSPAGDETPRDITATKKTAHEVLSFCLIK
jgi:hypothetical protein